MLISLCTCVFGLCIAFLMGISYLFNIPYSATCVYINLYLQYSILLISSLSILYKALKIYKLNSNYKNKAIVSLTILYNIFFIYGGYLLYNRYGVIDTQQAFNLCKNDLFYLVNIINPALHWTGYYIINVGIFIVGFLLILYINRKIRKRITI